MRYAGLDGQELAAHLKKNWQHHWFMLVIFFTASVVYWPLLAYISSKSMHRSNMTDAWGLFKDPLERNKRNQMKVALYRH